MKDDEINWYDPRERSAKDVRQQQWSYKTREQSIATLHNLCSNYVKLSSNFRILY